MNAKSPRAASPAFPFLSPCAPSLRRVLGAALVVGLAGGAACALAQAPISATPGAPAASSASSDFPPPRNFDAERKAISESRAWTQYRFAAAERACYDKFFITHCIDQAKETQRAELAVLRQRELELGEAERAYKAARRDREQALRQAEYEASQPQRAAEEQANRASFERKQQEQQLRDAQRQAEAPQRAANAAEYQQKQADYEARMREAREKGAEQARQRAENVQAFEAKQREAAQRQREVEERRAKAKERSASDAGAPRPFGF